MQRLGRLFWGNRNAATASSESATLMDHCVLGISSIRRPGVVTYIEYENIDEPRLVGMVIRPEYYAPKSEDYPLEWERKLVLNGSRREDAGKIAAWVKQEFLESEARQR
jgi:hypothetical protein